MPSTVNVNSRSVVHASSVGISTAFPDVCKTPAPPAPSPVPIPYPNVAMSSDTDGTSTVKANGASCMVKGSTFRMSSGDEAGVALGVASNKIKGKAEFVMYSFDVKFEGKNACRLSDPMQQNMGSANAMGPAEMQPMVPGLTFESNSRRESCKRKNKAQKEKAKKGGEATAWDSSGIVPGHRRAIQAVVTSLQIKVIFRATKAECAEWINKKYQPKPHDIIDGTTITASGRLPFDAAAAWLRRYKEGRDAAMAKGGPQAVAVYDAEEANNIHTYVTADPPGILGGESASMFKGIVGSTKTSDRGKPLLANIIRGTFYRSPYRTKYVTGDYDMQDVLVDRDTTCKRVFQKGSTFSTFQREANRKMKWDGIQHGPQAQWVAQKSHGDFSDFSMPELLAGWLSAKRGTPIPKVTLGEGRGETSVIDSKLTVVTPKGASALDNEGEVKDYLVCAGCKKPSEVRD